MLAARREGISLEWFPSLSAMGALGRLRLYDAAIVDYELGELSGVEVGEYLDAFLKGKPMLLISGDKREPAVGKEWPSAIRRFVHKGAGYQAILAEAKALTSQRTLQ